MYYQFFALTINYVSALIFSFVHINLYSLDYDHLNNKEFFNIFIYCN